MRFFSAIRAIYFKLHEELPPWLTYHTLEHTKDVYRMARQIGIAEGLDEHELKLILTATMLHDVGFIDGTDFHEKRSCVTANKMLPQFGYSEEDIFNVVRLIMATEIPHHPGTIIEKVICDADLDYLGRPDFFELAEKLFEELKYLGVVKNRIEWNKIQVKFLHQHQYFTSTAIDSRRALKNEHLLAIMNELASGKE